VQILTFLADNVPPLRTIVLGGPVGLLMSYTYLALAGHLKSMGWKTGYTRKVFHFLTFISVTVLQAIWGLPVVCLFGGMSSLVLLYVIIRGAGHPLYEAIAREKDEPHRTYFIVIPYLATLVGGITSNLLFGSYSVIGYLVAGMGDATGEPVGTRFGRHTYAVPSLKSVKSFRSYEGSAAVMLVSAIAIFVGASVLPSLNVSLRSVIEISLISVVCAILEAVSPPGWDNATLQIVPSLLAFCLLAVG
jgi:phytol kinase